MGRHNHECLQLSELFHERARGGRARRLRRWPASHNALRQPALGDCSGCAPDYRAAAYSFSFVTDEVLAEKEKICPTQVPFRAIARFVRDKAGAVGGALPLPPRIESLPPLTSPK